MASRIPADLAAILQQVEMAERFGEAEELIHAFQPREEAAAQRVAINRTLAQPVQQPGRPVFVQLEPAFDLLAMPL
jgi:hypothetical protein